MRVSARVRERTRLERQLGDTEGEVVAREGWEVEIHAEHVIRPVQGKGVGQGDAELRAGGRQIGARDLDLSRRLDRPAEERFVRQLVPVTGRIGVRRWSRAATLRSVSALAPIWEPSPATR